MSASAARPDSVNNPVSSTATFDTEMGAPDAAFGAEATAGEDSQNSPDYKNIMMRAKTLKSQAQAGVAGQAGKVQGKIDTKKLQSLVAKSVFGDVAPEATTRQRDDFELQKKWCGLLHPKTLTRKNYDLFQCLILLYFAYILPKRIGFEIEPNATESIVDMCIDLAIVFDIFLNFSCFSYDTNRTLVINPSKIKVNYMKSWFFIDLFSVVPLDMACRLVGELISNEDVILFANKLRLGRLIRFFRIFRLPKILNTRQLKSAMAFALKPVGITSVQIDFFFTVLFLVVVLVITTHIFGCYWAANGLRAYEEDQDGWMWKLFCSEADSILSLADGCTDSGGEKPVVEAAYWDSMYFAIVTMSSVGYGDISATTFHEKRVVYFMIVVGAFLYAFIIGNFSSMIEKMGKDQAAFDTKLRGISELMRFYAVPRELHEKVTAFYYYKFSGLTMFDENVIMNELPTSLRHTLVLHRFEKTIQMVPFLSGVREDVVVDLCQQIKSFCVMPDSHIMDKGAFQRELLILTRGVAMTVAAPDEEASVSHLMECLRLLGSSTVFDQFDTDGDGTIDADELLAGFVKLGEPLSPGELDALMSMLDNSGSGDLDMEEMELAMQVVRVEETTHEVGSFFGELEFLGRVPLSDAPCR